MRVAEAGEKSPDPIETRTDPQDLQRIEIGQRLSVIHAPPPRRRPGEGSAKR